MGTTHSNNKEGEGMRALVLLLGVLGWLSACSPAKDDPIPFDMSHIEEEGLVVLTRNAPTTYFIDRDENPVGFEHDVVQDFARYLGVEVHFKQYDSIKDIQEALAQGEGHLAAAGLTELESRSERFEVGPRYYQVQPYVVCRRNGPQPKRLEDLTEVSLLVTGESSYVELLEQLKANQEPELRWNVAEDLTTEQILEKVWREEVDCTVADDNIFAINRRYFPELTEAFPLSDTPNYLVWLLPKGATELKDALFEWYEDANDEARITFYAARYFAHVENFDYVDVATFVRRISSRLPKYEALFRDAAAKYHLDWRLLAAQAYQESHWDPSARSPTGVRGIMMLTQSTAKELGVYNRLDPEQSIEAGARYLANLRDRLPETIEEPHRTWMALAAYNIGMGHLLDARALTERLGLDPDNWFDLQQALPKLSQPQYYRTLRFGYARGGEPVQYLSRIRNYEDILHQQLKIRELEREQKTQASNP